MARTKEAKLPLAVVQDFARKLQDIASSMVADHLEAIQEDLDCATDILEANLPAAKAGARDAAQVSSLMLRHRQQLREERLDLFRPAAGAATLPRPGLEDGQGERLRRLISQLSPEEQREAGILQLADGPDAPMAADSGAAIDATQDEQDRAVVPRDDNGGTPEVTH